MPEQKAPFWGSRKFWYVVITQFAFTVLIVSGTAEFSSEQIITFMLTVLGIATGGHAATDIAAIVSKKGGTQVTGDGGLPHMNVNVPMPSVKPAIDEERPGKTRDDLPAMKKISKSERILTKKYGVE